MNDFLEARHITKRYAHHTALDDVTIQLPEAKIFGLLGPNGAGKSTLIRIINRIAMADAGEILLRGCPLRPDDITRIGYLPEERGLYKKMKVGEQAIYLARLKGLDASEARKRLRLWFEKFNIMPWWHKNLEELSKGMQQKVQFIITVLHEPELLIFDEPFSGFDPVNAALLKSEILALRDKGHTILFSTHNMESVEEICDNIALINQSKVVLEGNVQMVRQRFQDNSYEIVVETPHSLSYTSPLYDIITQRADTTTTQNIRLHKHADVTTSELLAAITAKAEVLSFQKCIPSMNEIFIKQVSTKSAIVSPHPLV